MRHEETSQKVPNVTPEWYYGLEESLVAVIVRRWPLDGA